MNVPKSSNTGTKFCLVATSMISSIFVFIETETLSLFLGTFETEIVSK